MNAKWLGMALIAVAATASGQTIYRTVTGNGKVVFSDEPVASENGAKPNQVKTYSASELGGGNPASQTGGENNGLATPPACRADAGRFCGQSSGKSYLECLLDHQQEITDGCYDAMKRQMQSGQRDQGSAAPGGQTCRQDAQRFCKDVQPGGGRIVDCLLDHQKDLSDACYDTLAKRKPGKR